MQVIPKDLHATRCVKVLRVFGAGYGRGQGWQGLVAAVPR